MTVRVWQDLADIDIGLDTAVEMTFVIKVVNCLTNSIAVDPGRIIDGAVLTSYFGENFSRYYHL